jgi:hypothetical protein
MVIDIDNKTILPVSKLESIIKKLGVVYSSCLEKLFIVNAGWIVKTIYSGVKNLIHPDTQKKI